uniref:AGC-kinase C-terminal domain-containing protein n=1 Tax=Euplotes harpa TaxID=151035 RepID=A0A7S3NHD3_9SPIT|mmetsp:Transcript_7277/g.8259  ORF Transcript_7277/g.8259 Transcript_7277/m.8259 type:complete len:129 (+) Transcript_7277:165-551(+)
MKKEFSEDAKDLIVKLLEPKPSLRIGHGPDGAKNIKQHPFFSQIDWEQLYNKAIEPPFVPVVQNDEDISQIDTLFTKELPQETPVVSKLKDHEKAQNHFGGFTFERRDILSMQNKLQETKSKSSKSKK